MKKVLSLITAITIALAFAACAGRSKNADEGTLTWYMRKPTNDMSHQQMVEDAANKVFKEALDAEVLFKFLDSAQWESKMNVMMSSGEPFDLLFCDTYFLSYRTNNALLDIKDLIGEYGPDITAKVDAFAWDAVKKDGGVYGVPGQTRYTPYFSFAFKKDLVDKYGFAYQNIKSLTELEPYLATIKANHPDIYPLLGMSTGASMPLSTRYLPTSIDWIHYDKQTGRFVSVLDSMDDMDNYKTLYGFYQKGYTPKDALSKADYLSEIRSGKYAVFGGRADETKTSDLYGFPCVEANTLYGVISTKNVLNAVTAVSRTSKNPKKAIEVLNLIWKDPNLSNLLAYGVKNADYTVERDGDYTQKRVVPNGGANMKWAIWHNWLGPLWDQWDSPWNSRESLMAMKAMNETAEVSPILGFVIDTASLKTEIAQISTITGEALPVFYTGSMPDFEKFADDLRKKLSAAGMEKVLAETELQYSAWKANR